MPPTPQKPPESHYQLEKLHKFFAFAAITLLIGLMAIFAKDYSREWKKYQKQYSELELEKTKVKYDLESKALEKNEEYLSVAKEEESAKNDLKAEQKRIEVIHQEIAVIQAAINILTQKSQFAKAEYDTLKYDFEVARSHKDARVPAMQQKLNSLSEQISTLRLSIEEKQTAVDRKNDEIKSIEKTVKDLEKKSGKIAQRKILLERKLNRVDPERMSLANHVAEAIRDLPVIELANSNYRVKQIVLKDITDDVNITRVPKVDRCITCHLGIDNPDFKDAPQPLRAHPNLEMFMDKDSPHPLETFACTTCHLGRGRATDFFGAVHTPRNEEQRKIWEKKYGWKHYHHWEKPMLPVGMTQASCFKCHSNETVVKGADELNLGLNLIEKAGCYNCHVIDKYKDWPKSGPTLEFLASKTTKDWAYRWIEDPQSIRPDTWMPSYYNLSNNSDPDSKVRAQQEIHAIVEYLFANSKPYLSNAPDMTGDLKRGEELVASIGCFACHQIKKDDQPVVRTRDQLRREHGPNLVGMGSKTTKEWLYDWLKNPGRYHPQTRMPNMRLKDQEAMDIATYLAQDQTASLKPSEKVNNQVLTDMVKEFMIKNSTLAQASKELSSMSVNDKLQYAGKRLIRQYGCYSCHTIPGFENEKPIGAELTFEGDKNAHGLDFGLVHIPHTKQAWFKQKLLDPRIFDQGKIKTADEKLRMPDFHFSEAEADAIVTALMGFVKDRPAASLMAPRTPDRVFVEQGQKLVRQFNCQSCHVMENEGGGIQDSVTDWLVKYQAKDPNDAKALAMSFSPPNLVGEGRKVHAQWLFDFIHEPTTIRPWLSVRMPSYNFHPNELNTLVKYFSYLDSEEFPFPNVYDVHAVNPEELAAGEKLFSKDYFGCASCHIVGDQMPGGSPDSWAPDFAMARARLKPDWIIQWMTNPQELLPGTKMPTYFDPNSFDASGPEDLLNGDERAQIRALRDYLMTLSDRPAILPAGNPPVATEAQPGNDLSSN